MRRELGGTLAARDPKPHPWHDVELPIAGPLIIAGAELATFHGNAPGLGTRGWIDWRSEDRMPRAAPAGPDAHVAAGRAGPVALNAVWGRGHSEADIQAGWMQCAQGSAVRLVGDSVTLHEEAADGAGARQWDDVRARWCTLEIRHGRGGMLAATRPVCPEGA